MQKPILIDIGPMACGCDEALEDLHKAMAAGSSGTDIWMPHDDPLLRDVIERFTLDGLACLTDIQDELLRYITFEDLHKSYEDALERLNRPFSGFSPDDALLLVDTLVEKKFSNEQNESRAQWLAWRATLAGYLSMLGVNGALGKILADSTLKLPSLPEKLGHAWSWSKARIGIALKDVTSVMRSRMARHICAHLDASPHGPTGKLEQSLRDTFGELHRDWRRIAITEAGETANQAVVSALKPGSKVKRVEAYTGACQFCKKLHGRVFSVVSQDAPNKDGDHEIWPGKTNVGRSASPWKRTGGGLIERDRDEMWWPAAGLQHPHCRGSWLPVMETPPDMDADFAKWLQSEIDKVKSK